MNTSIAGKKAVFLLAVVAIMIGLTPVASGQPQIIFNNLPVGPLTYPAAPPTPPTFPYNVTSLSYQAATLVEAGDGIIPGGTQRRLFTFSALMSNWACQNMPGGFCGTTAGSPAPGGAVNPALLPTYNASVILRIYNVTGATGVGSQITSITQTFAIPFRPSADPTCLFPDDWRAADGQCYAGISVPITFTPPANGVLLPARFIATITVQNAFTAGIAAGPADSLNLGAEGVAPPPVGNNIDPDSIWMNATPGGIYDCGQGGGLQINQCFAWNGAHPLFQIAATDAPMFLTRYAANLTSGDSVVNITNSGAHGAQLNGPNFGAPAGNVCANVYAFSPDEQMIACCACLVTPNGLASLSVVNDLISNTLTGVRPSSIVIKILATAPSGTPAAPNFGTTTCNPAAIQTAAGAIAVHAWGTTLHAAPAANTFAMTETPFLMGTISDGEAASLANRCTNIIGNGSTFGVCRSCRFGGLGAGRI